MFHVEQSQTGALPHANRPLSRSHRGGRRQPGAQVLLHAAGHSERGLRYARSPRVVASSCEHPPPARTDVRSASIAAHGQETRGIRCCVECLASAGQRAHIDSGGSRDPQFDVSRETVVLELHEPGDPLKRDTKRVRQEAARQGHRPLAWRRTRAAPLRPRARTAGAWPGIRSRSMATSAPGKNLRRLRR